MLISIEISLGPPENKNSITNIICSYVIIVGSKVSSKSTAPMLFILFPKLAFWWRIDAQKDILNNFQNLPLFWPKPLLNVSKRCSVYTSINLKTWAESSTWMPYPKIRGQIAHYHFFSWEGHTTSLRWGVWHKNDGNRLGAWGWAEFERNKGIFSNPILFKRCPALTAWPIKKNVVPKAAS